MAYFWLSCLHRMRTTFLLPLARMLEAFYRAIKAVNQSLLNDPWFLTCFTGSDTVVAAHCTHGFTLRPTDTIYCCLVCECTLQQRFLRCWCWIACNGSREQRNPGAAVVFQLPMYSCRDVFAIFCT